jgi:hypothetical protein
MLIDLSSEAQKNDLIYLINKVKAYCKDLGSYIEHFYYTDNIVIVKLTNGFIKVNETTLLQHYASSESVKEVELKKIGATFLKTLL